MKNHFHKKIFILRIISIFLCFSFNLTANDQSEKTPEIIKIIVEGRDNNLKEWLNNGNKPNAKIGNVPIVLFTTIDKCRYSSLKILLDSGADPNASAGSLFYPLLMNAAQQKDLSCLKLLIENGAQINIQDKDGNNAYYYTIFSKNYASIEILYDNGLNLFHRNNDGLTAIDIAILADKGHIFKKSIRKYTEDN